MKLNKETMITVASIAGSVMTVAATLLNNYVQEEKLNDKIDKRVAEAIANLSNSKEEQALQRLILLFSRRDIL